MHSNVKVQDIGLGMEYKAFARWGGHKAAPGKGRACGLLSTADPWYLEQNLDPSRYSRNIHLI